MAKRREIMKRRRVNDDYIATWFRYQPVSKPAPRPPELAPASYKAAGRSREQFEY